MSLDRTYIVGHGPRTNVAAACSKKFPINRILPCGSGKKQNNLFRPTCFFKGQKQVFSWLYMTFFLDLCTVLFLQVEERFLFIDIL